MFCFLLPVYQAEGINSEIWYLKHSYKCNINALKCSELHYTLLGFFFVFFVPVTERTYLCDRVIIHCHLSLFFCLVWGYYNDCAVGRFSGVSWYILHSALQQSAKATTRISCLILTGFFFSQVMNSVVYKCGKADNADFITVFICFVLRSLGQERGQHFYKGRGRW